MISFIIPALNEEKNIRRSVRQFSKLIKEKKVEVIVGDGGSKDKTIKIAKELGAKIVKNRKKKQNAAVNRNNGAKKAKGDILVFCDADTQLEDPVGFIRDVRKVFFQKDIVAAVPMIKVFPKKRIWKDNLFSGVLNNFQKIAMAFNLPYGSGQCQVVRKSAFEKVGGYDDEIVHSEDSDLFRKLRKIGNFSYLNGQTVYESPRRYRKWGYRKLIWKGISSIFSQRVLKKQTIKEWERVD